MSTGAATASTAFATPSFSLGPVKVQIMDYSAVSGDTAATATFTGLSRVDYAILIGAPAQSAVPTYSGNVASFTFADPAATVKCQVIGFGK